MFNPAPHATNFTLPITSRTFILFMVTFQVKIQPHTLDYVNRYLHKTTVF